MSTPREHIPVVILPDHDAIAEAVAQEIIEYIQAQAAQKKKAVLGLATGSTPIGVYQRLVESHRRGMSFRHVITFNLDEYYPMSPDSLQSYQRYMHEYLFDHLDIPQDQVFIPTGDVPRDQVVMHCTWYEECIKQAGGIGIQVLGIGRTGHIGFNEPGSLPDTRTRLIRLDEITRKDAAADFFGEENVPLEAITMGVGIPAHKTRFLDLPFYQTGQVKKNPIGEDDIRIILDLLNEVQPDVVFVAGDLSDPHGTHRMCKDAIERALQRDARTRPEIWLYRGAWQEWEIDEADVFVPLSYDELSRKIQAIFKHESQKDVAMFPGAYDDREFWERVQDRNTATARLLDRLGLPQYYAIEAFVIE